MFRTVVLLLAASTLYAADAPAPASDPYREAIVNAQIAERKGLLGNALKELDRAQAIDPRRVEAYFLRGRIHITQRKSDEAILALNKVIELEPKASTAYNLRGQEHFKGNRIEKAIKDFNRYIQLEPQQEPYHWQRGIAFYYAGKFDEGRKQFELHQTVNSHDVENAVWHFLCVARSQGIDKARASLIPITGDRRIPMSEVYDLFAGKLKPEDVIKAAKTSQGTPAQLEDREFYAELYLGLYFEAKGDSKLAYDHIKKAATEYLADHYMGDVARVHFKRLVQNPAK